MGKAKLITVSAQEESAPSVVSFQALGEMLRQLRLARGETQESIVRAAGIGRRTLSRWEAGQALPRLPELHALLCALDATPSERQYALALLEAPRGHRALRQATQEHESAAKAQIFGEPVGQGDLLRAMRLRRLLPLEQVADSMLISPSTLSRWERGEVLPSEDALNRLITLLGAHPSERAALTQGILRPRDLPRPSLSTAESSLDTHWERWERFKPLLYRHTQDALLDLAFIALETDLWPLAHHPSGRQLLAIVFAYHADYLLVFRRYTEAQQFAARALRLAQPSDADSPDTFLVRAAIVAADAIVYQAPRTAPRRGLELLRRYAPQAKSKTFTAWAMSNEAHYLSLLGRQSDALSRAREACQLSSYGSQVAEIWLRQRDMAELLLNAGRPNEALPLIQVGKHASPTNRALAALLRAQALHDLKAPDAARQLVLAFAEIEAHDLYHLRGQAKQLDRVINGTTPPVPL